MFDELVSLCRQSLARGLAAGQADTQFRLCLTAMAKLGTAVTNPPRLLILLERLGLTAKAKKLGCGDDARTRPKIRSTRRRSGA